MTRLEFHAVHDPEYALAAAAVHVRPADVDRHRRREAIGRRDADPGLTLETSDADRDSELAGRRPSIPERLSKLTAGLNPRSRREAAPSTAHRSANVRRSFCRLAAALVSHSQWEPAAQSDKKINSVHPNGGRNGQ
jgi:hypothetical protein